MADSNGSGRLDRIEANLERLTERFNAMVEHHDAEFKKLMTWQVLMQDEVRKLAEEEAAYRREQRERDIEYRNVQRERDAALDQRIDKLVSGIGVLIQRLPERGQSQ